MSGMITVLGVPLAPLSVGEAVARGVEGGLILAPSGPGLCALAEDPEYRDALARSDLNLTDSGFLLLVRVLRGHRPVTRTSGLRYLEELLQHAELRTEDATLWVLPSPTSKTRSLAWLSNHEVRVDEEHCYVAPLYPRQGPVEDAQLLALIERHRPRHVFLCIGSGIQEKLGDYLMRNLTYRPGIHCIGAAIAFLTGDQAPIPMWADRLYLGWLIRCVNDPKVFVPRYLRALKLGYLVLRYDDKAPPIR